MVNKHVSSVSPSSERIPRRANTRNVSIRISLRWPIHIINPVDKTQLSRYTSHQRSTTVSLETYPSIHFFRLQAVSHSLENRG